MTKKRTMPFEPEEFPVNPERPDIWQPTDPGEQELPQEAPGNIPDDLPNEQPSAPEVNPDEFEK